MLLNLFSFNCFAGRILFIGDSHSTAPFAPFGSKMNTLLRTLPKAEVSFHSRCGSIVNWWYSGINDRCGFFDQEAEEGPLSGKNKPTPLIASMMDQLNPQLIIIELGANYMYGNDWAANAKTDVQKLVEDLRKRSIPCLWVGQPDYRLPGDPVEAEISLNRRNALIQAIRETVEPICTYVDSTTMTRYPVTGGDGHHYSMKEGLEIGFAWADTVFQEFVIPLYRE
jgi:hypothetical protein